MKKVTTVTLMVVVCTLLISGQKTCYQEREDHLAFTRSFQFSRIDTLSVIPKSSNSQIHINGQSNSIIIEKNSSDHNKSNIENSINVNGTNNSIYINQSHSSTQTTIIQNGNSNNIKIKQEQPKN